MTQPSAPIFTLHKSACPDNFWKDSCKDAGICNLLHIRETNKTLHIVNSCINLNRVQRKCKLQTPSTDLTATKLPTNCELYIVDSIVDPEDFANQIIFKNNHIFVARSFGLHASTVAPSEYFTAILIALLTIEKEFKLAFVGPFGGESNVPPKDRYNAKTYANAFIAQHKQDLKTSALTEKTPICLNSSDVTVEYALGPAHFIDGGHRFIWTNVNRQRTDRFKMLVGRYTKCSSSHYSTLSQTSSTEIFDNLRQAFMDDEFDTKSRLLFNSELVNKMNETNEVLPLAVINTIITIYIRLSVSTHAWSHHFKKRFPTLIDFNKHATRCALEIFPITLFSSDPALTNHLKARTHQLFTPLYTKFANKISYGHQPKTQRFQGSLTDTNFSMPKALKPSTRQALMEIQNTKPTSALKRTTSQSDLEAQPSKRIDRKPDPFISFTTEEELESFIKKRVATALEDFRSTPTSTSPMQEAPTGTNCALIPPPLAAQRGILPDKCVTNYIDDEGRSATFVSCGTTGGSTITITRLNNPVKASIQKSNSE